MRKDPLFLIILLLMCSLIRSQEIKIGLKGGVNYNYIGDFLSQEGAYYPADNEIGYQFGVFVDVGFDKFFVRPEANYVSLKNSYEFPTKPAQWATQQIDIPILFGYNIYYPVAIYAGPVFSFISEMAMEGWQDTSYADPFDYNTSSTGVSAGILIDLDRIGIDFRYQYGITTVKEQRLDMIKNYNGYGVNLGDLVEYNSSQIMVSIHIKIADFSNIKQNRKVKKGWRNHKNCQVLNN